MSGGGDNVRFVQHMEKDINTKALTKSDILYELFLRRVLR